MRVIVDFELCEGNGRCVAAAAEVFRLDDDAEQVELLTAEPGAEQRSAVARAARVCPRQAIRIVGEPGDDSGEE